ncbi:hypothetical protein Tco_1562386 [Tanacetum coccineum]
MRADEKSQMYMIFSHMLKSFNKEFLEDLYKLVKAKYKSTRLVEDLDLLLWGDLKIMFEPHVEDEIHKLVEKKYPLIPSTLTMMLEKKLMIDYESEMAYQLLKFIIKHLKNLLDAVRITATQVYVNTALMKLVLLMKFKETILIDVVFDGAFGGVADEEVVVREGVVVISSSPEMLINSCLGGIMVSLIFLEGLEEEA